MKKVRVAIALVAILLSAGAVFRSWPELSKLDLARGPTRAAWQRPDEVVAALGIRPGDRVADLGAGDGYFVFKLADAVGPAGRVYAVDVDPPVLQRLEKNVQLSDYSNIDVVYGELDDPRLPDRAIDVVFLCNTYHHIEGRTAYFSSLQGDLKPGGRVAVVDMRGDLTGIAGLFGHEGHSIPWSGLYGEMEIAGYRLARRLEFLPVQHFGIFVPNE